MDDTTPILWYAHTGKTTRSQVCASGITSAGEVRAMIARGSVLSTFDATTEDRVDLTK